MKYLKKFESSTTSFYDDVNSFFIEFIDDELAYTWKDNGYIGIEFSLESEIDNIDSAISVTSKNLNILEDIKVAINRLKDKFGEIIINYYMDSDLSNFTLKVYEPSKVEVGDFYTKNVNFILLDSKKLKEILKLEKSVALSIWSGKESELKILFTNKEQFMRHMYRDYLDRRDELPNSFNNEIVDDALIFNPELMERYWKLGKHLANLKIDDINFIKKIENIYKGQERTYYGVGGRSSREEWSVSLSLNNKFKYEI